MPVPCSCVRTNTSPPRPPPVVMTKNVSRHCQVSLLGVKGGQNHPQLRTTAVERRNELGSSLTVIFMDRTGISGAGMALLSCQQLGGDGLAIILSYGAITGHGCWKGAWQWVRWLSVAGATGPSLKGDGGHPSVHDMGYSTIINLLVSIFHSMTNLLRIGAMPYLALCHPNLAWESIRVK